MTNKLTRPCNIPYCTDMLAWCSGGCLILVYVAVMARLRIGLFLGIKFKQKGLFLSTDCIPTWSFHLAPRSDPCG